MSNPFYRNLVDQPLRYEDTIVWLKTVAKKVKAVLIRVTSRDAKPKSRFKYVGYSVLMADAPKVDGKYIRRIFVPDEKGTLIDDVFPGVSI